jgi:hypothetical protein
LSASIQVPETKGDVLSGFAASRLCRSAASSQGDDRFRRWRLRKTLRI